MIRIINTSKMNGNKTIYNLFINDEFICNFEHRRSEGLSRCLIEAGIAVKIMREKKVHSMIKALNQERINNNGK